MDSITQITLGAAMGEAVLGRKVGYRAALWGGICGTLPDLDSFILYGDAVANVTYHRSASHSVFVLLLLSPIIVWLIRKIHSDAINHHRGWILLVLMALLTHPVLDCFTVYGTQILWPFYIYPVSWSTIFIIDPAYTLPLLIGVLSALIMSRSRQSGHYLNYAGIAVSSLYLTWTVGIKLYVEKIAVDSLLSQDIRYDKLLTTPAPVNTLLWRIIAMDDTGYYDAYYSVFDKSDRIKFAHYPSDESLLKGMEGHWPVQRLRWFTHGYYSVSLRGNAVVMTDLRMGMEPNYIFNYKVAEMGNPHTKPVTSEHMPQTWNRDQFSWVWHRLTHPQGI